MNDKPQRDTQFAGFAEALFYALDWNEINIDMEEDGWEDRWKLIIARRAYDLVLHACETVDDKESQEESRITSDYMLSSIPDMPELPKEQE